MKKLVTFLVTIVCLSISYGQEIASYSSLQDIGCSGIVNNDGNVTATGICRGPGVTSIGAFVYTSRHWSTTSSIGVDDYLEWTLTPNPGYQMDLTTMDISYRRNGDGPTMAEIQVDAGSGFTTIFTDSSVNPGIIDVNNDIDISFLTNVTSTITFRLYAYNAWDLLGRFNIEENTETNKGVVINGVASLICTSISTWDGISWSPSAPTITTTVVIAADYDSDTLPSFSACSLTVNTGTTLIIDDSKYVEVENDIVADGNIIVRSQGALVQNNNYGSVTENGSIIVEKTTSPLFNWYEYTYWSSPVSGETIANGLSESSANRIFWFNGANYEDALAETNNNNILVPGQDGIDDNGDAWTFANGIDIMLPGIGYAATHNPSTFSGPGSPPYQFSYTFEGPFNNGIINIPLVRNDTELNDLNWNFIGNPYPSAIDVDAFFNENSYTLNPTGVLDGAIYLWSQNTDPNATNNGNENSNFISGDYAIINGVGETAGGDGVIPNRFIPSGQGVFVTFSDSRPSNSGNVVFNNAMRVTGNNTQFFRSNTSSEINKLWIDLRTDSGLFNQTLIGYVNGCTDGFDGNFYDTPKDMSLNTSAKVYSILPSDNMKFAIQGKDPNNLGDDEIINLGFVTMNEDATIYKLSVGRIEGNFFNDGTIYLKDNLLNIVHNLSESEYGFVAEIGEFNNRFQLSINQELLSNMESELSLNDLKIIELPGENFKFIVRENFYIASITIMDYLGRIVRNLEGFSNSQICNLSGTAGTMFIAKTKLSNGQVITKKMIKTK